MSPPTRTPVPLPIAKGRAQPGSPMHRPETPAAQKEVNPAFNTANKVGVEDASVEGYRAFKFTFESAVRPGLPAISVPNAGSIWGRTYVAGQGNLHFEASPRIDHWLGRFQTLSLARGQEGEEDDSKVPSAFQGDDIAGECTTRHMLESARAGDKRNVPLATDEDETPALDQPARKRTRVGDALQRTIPRLGSRRRIPISPFSFASQLSTSVPGLSSSLSVVVQQRQQEASMVGSQTVKVCLVGDIGAGKTALFNRLAGKPFVSTSTSLVPEFSYVRVRCYDWSIINVELWDFPGIVAGARPGPLLSTFFHAAIICFSLEKEDNLRNVVEVWKPKLNACLHDQHIFVLGLKRDLRAALPTLDLSFLRTPEPATAEMVRPVSPLVRVLWLYRLLYNRPFRRLSIHCEDAN
ncbi:P-loop containing nucleoside triphosphate hydrolase protein [Corynascus novoguineensis]|uniref:P-loop containing nucleoside triphosphate hydrolase protein n=1 Tax=Corynascus novoguineensis TaxID=1126955 RepID=A0AAN7CNB2_9PEZI|nr:P-loop containing nucleoside triphosphate hydrolase protein [Corynascus novoguineensis]